MDEAGYERATQLILDCITTAGIENYLFTEWKFSSVFDHSIMRKLNSIVLKVNIHDAISLGTAFSNCTSELKIPRGCLNSFAKQRKRKVKV